MHMPRSDARLDHLPTSAWSFGGHNGTRINNLEQKHREIVERLDTLAKTVENLSGKIDNSSRTINRDSLSPESDTQGGHPEQESPDDAAQLADKKDELEEESSKIEVEIQELQVSQARKLRDMGITHQQAIHSLEKAQEAVQNQINGMDTKIQDLVGQARKAGEPPMLKSGPPANATRPLLLTNGAQSRYAVRIPR